MKYINLTILSLLLISPCFASVDDQDIVSDKIEAKEAVRQFNDEVRKTSRRLRALESGIDINSGTTGILTIDRGGTGQDLSTAPANSIPYFASTGTLGNIGIGTTGYLLTAGNPPSYSTPPPTTPALQLISTTTISGASTTGSLSLVNGTTYFVQYNFYNLSAPSAINLRFNGDSGSNYKYAYEGTDTAASIRAGSAAASSIFLAPSVVQDAAEGISGSFYIKQIGTATQVYHIWGSSSGQGSSDGYWIINNAGRWFNTANIASFALLSVAGSTMNGIVSLYKVTT